MSDIPRSLRATTDLFLPRRCVVCGRSLYVHEDHICTRCLADLPLTRFWETWRNPMGDKFNALVQKRVSVYEPYSRAAALFHYRSYCGYKRIPQSLKYYGAVREGRWFASMLGRRLAGSPYFRDVTLVVPVPLHWTRRLSRGYNQAEIIASAVAREMGVRMEPGLLRRRRRTKTQTRVSPELKAANVSGAFSVDVKRLSRALRGSGQLEILLVDDVFTTGATLAACHGALRRALSSLGVSPRSVRISIATLGAVGCG